MGRRSAVTLRNRAQRLLSDRLSTLGQSAARSRVLVRQQWRALARMRPPERLRQQMAGVAQRLRGKQGALVAVAGIALLSLAATLVLQSPKPRPDQAPAVFAQPILEPSAGVVSTAARDATTGPRVDPDPAQSQTAPKPSDRPPSGDRSVDGDRGAAGQPSALAVAQEKPLHSPDAIDQSPVVTPGTDSVASAVEDDVIETIGLPESEAEATAGMPPAVEHDVTVDLLAKGNPGTLLLAPTAGQPGSPGAAVYPVSEGPSVALTTMPSFDGNGNDTVPEADPGAAASGQPPEQPSVADDSASASVPTPVDSVQSPSDQTDEIALWLEHANAALQRDRLLFPESDSAVSYYRRILEHDAQHSEAIAGMERIVERYLALARSAFDRREFERADRLIDRALRVSPNHAGSLALRRQVADTRAEQQAEAERQRQAVAAETAARAEAARLAAAAEAAREAELARQRSSLDDLLWWQN
jgi:hypothetical protein